MKRIGLVSGVEKRVSEPWKEREMKLQKRKKTRYEESADSDFDDGRGRESGSFFSGGLGEQEAKDLP